MADGLTTQSSTLATIPSGTEIATDDCSTDGHAQIVKLAISTDGSATLIPAVAADGLLVNLGSNNDVLPAPSVARVQASQTTNASAYEAGDAIGALMTFANAARTSGGSIHIESVQIVDEDSQAVACDLVLFRASITAPTDDAVFDPTDAELLDCVGVVKFTAADYSTFNDNSVAHKDCAITAKLSGTSLFGALVTRGTPTYASTSSIHVTVTVVQD